MRSRYTAFVVGDSDYLSETWHPGTRPDRVDADDGTRWLSLEILDAPDPSPTRGVVEFVATYRYEGQGGRLHERSRFVFQSQRWWYLDGTVSQDQ